VKGVNLANRAREVPVVLTVDEILEKHRLLKNAFTRNRLLNFPTLILYRNYSAAENYRNITLRAVMIFYSPIGSRDSKIIYI
jgi:hypothetical protein